MGDGNEEKNRVYQEKLYGWLKVSIQAVFSLLSSNLYTFPYVVNKPHSIASKKSEAVYGPDGKVASTTAEDDAAKGSTITALDIKEITSMLPSDDDQEQLLAILLLSSFYISISPRLPVSLNGFGKACFPPDYMEKLRNLLSKSQTISNMRSNSIGNNKKSTTRNTPVQGGYNANAKNKSITSKNRDMTSSLNIVKTGVYDLLLDNMRTVEVLRPITMTINMVTLSSTGTIRIMVWLLLHKLEEVRFRAARVFKEILDNPLRIEKRGIKDSIVGGKKHQTQKQHEDLESLEPEVTVM